MAKLRLSLQLALICIAVLFTISAMAATNIDDGFYSINYSVLQTNNDSVSIANDYFQKPATLTVKDGKQYVEFTVLYSEWVKYIKSPRGDAFEDVIVVSEDLENNRRVVAFKVNSDISEPIPMQMHIQITSMQPTYDHQYTVRFAFDASSIEAMEAPPELPSYVASDSNSSMILLIVIGIIVIALIITIILLVRGLRKTKQ